MVAGRAGGTEPEVMSAREAEGCKGIIANAEAFAKRVNGGELGVD